MLSVTDCWSEKMPAVCTWSMASCNASPSCLASVARNASRQVGQALRWARVGTLFQRWPIVPPLLKMVMTPVVGGSTFRPLPPQAIQFERLADAPLPQGPPNAGDDEESTPA